MSCVRLETEKSCITPTSSSTWSQQLRRRDGEDGEPGFAGMDVETEVASEFDPDSHFLFWKPGTRAQQEPPDMAWRLDPGSDLIVNLHLQPSGALLETIEAQVGLYFTGIEPLRGIRC